MHFLSLFFAFAAALASVVNAGCYPNGQTGTFSHRVQLDMFTLCANTLSGYYENGQQRGNCVPDADAKNRWVFNIKKTGGKSGSLKPVECQMGFVYWMMACPTRGGKGTARTPDNKEISGFEFRADVNRGSCEDPAYSKSSAPNPTPVANAAKVCS
ncbi:hypothetical protein K469DRAFT_761486 [Zopfia rhizophila CBS 207.26]|uniref:Uncharacterized protein n=1 Tax=Zopfia rhizophila CBS 207.26 TaxID=1314779 RepID=A0A6A6DAE0_9PEZI|nr:hypothetical protein K469DRAFT_761486 [Zopfia rhizophila CBS 207.26]